MAPWSFMRINYLPMTMGVIFTFGMVLCFCVSVLRGDVSPYIPFISETGGQFPEAGLFSMFLYFCSTVGTSTMVVRFLIVDELNRSLDRAIDILNRSSLVIGFLALMGMVVVAAYPMTSIALAHNIGANVLFLGGSIYAGLQTALSFKMSPYFNGKMICWIRFTITILTIISLVVMIVLVAMGQSEWSTGTHTHWTGGKTPHDKGFSFLLAGALAEWSMAILYVAFYFTYIREFSKVHIHLEVQLLVQHFDDVPHAANIAVATEHTPIVM